MGTPKLTNKQKLSIVIEGIKGRPVAEICSSYGISQAQYYRIRDQFFSNAEEVFMTLSLRWSCKLPEGNVWVDETDDLNGWARYMCKAIKSVDDVLPVMVV